MFSRLTASAALFAILATATLAFAAETHVPHAATARIQAGEPAAMEVVVMPTVTVIGRRAI